MHLLKWIIRSCFLDCTHDSHANPIQQWHSQQCHGEERHHTQECVHGQWKQQHQTSYHHNPSLFQTAPVDQVNN